MVVRGGEVLLQSTPLQHFFDCPFQMGALPEHVSATDYAEVPQFSNFAKLAEAGPSKKLSQVHDTCLSLG